MPTPKRRWNRPSHYGRQTPEDRNRLLFEHLVELSAQLDWVNERLAWQGFCAICFMRDIAKDDSDFEHDCVEGHSE